MKRIIALAIGVIGLLLITGCSNGSVGNGYDNQSNDDSETFYYHSAEIDETPLPHPFATALREYMAGYDGIVRAYLVTLDDNGTMGVLTTRPTTKVLVDYDTGEYAYEPSGMLFYIQDGDLFQIDVSGWFFVAGRYNRLMERLDAHTHIVEVIYKLEFGRLEISTRLEYFSDDYLSMLFDDYDVVAERIAERDAFVEYAREKYELVALPPPNFGHKRNTEDQTAQILAMTINCVPSLPNCSALWQEAYAEILRLYATGQYLKEWEVSWNFALHDINHDGVPELLLESRQESGHFYYRYVYTFADGVAIPLAFEGFLTDGGIFSHIDDSPWVIAFLAAGSGGWYRKLEMVGHGLLPIAEGMALLSDKGHEMMLEEGFDLQNYEWFNLTLNENEVTAEEFESVFGSWNDRVWLNFYEVNNDNIMRIIFEQ